MVASEVFRLETLQPADDERECVANREHRRRAGAGGEAQPASFVEFAERNRHVGRLRPSVFWFTGGDRDQRHVELTERRQQLDDFAGLATLRKHQHHVARLHAPQIAVEGFSRMQKMSTCAGRGERRGQLLRDQPGFAHAGHNQVAA